MFVDLLACSLEVWEKRSLSGPVSVLGNSPRNGHPASLTFTSCVKANPTHRNWSPLSSLWKRSDSPIFRPSISTFGGSSLFKLLNSRRPFRPGYRQVPLMLAAPSALPSCKSQAAWNTRAPQVSPLVLPAYRIGLCSGSSGVPCS